MAALFCLTLIAAPASAKPSEAPYTPWYSTVDCGGGEVNVVSAMEDEWSNLEDVDSRRRFEPVEWHLQIGDFTYDAVRPGKLPKRTITCAYRDDYAAGTVVVKRTGHVERDLRGHSRSD